MCTHGLLVRNFALDYCLYLPMHQALLGLLIYSYGDYFPW